MRTRRTRCVLALLASLLLLVPDVELGIWRTFAVEADDPMLEAEVAPGEIIIAADQVCATGEARSVGEPANLQVRPPAAVDPQPLDAKVVADARRAYPGYLPIRARLYADAWDEVARTDG